MQVKLKVLKGVHAGREISVSGAEFAIGRSEECQLRPRSDMISRKHCAVVVGHDGVLLRDFGSKNGTYVNSRRVDGEQILKIGDHVRVGPLEFEILIDHAVAGPKRAKVRDMKEVAARSAVSARAEEMDISSWLEEADLADKERKLVETETRQFKLDDTARVALEQAAAEHEGPKEPGKLPKMPEKASRDTKEAAQDALRKIFRAGGQ